MSFQGTTRTGPYVRVYALLTPDSETCSSSAVLCLRKPLAPSLFIPRPWQGVIQIRAPGQTVPATEANSWKIAASTSSQKRSSTPITTGIS